MSHNHSTFKGLVTLKNNQAITTSLKISEVFEKNHKHILRDIKSLLECPEVDETNFGLISYADNSNRQKPMYELNRDGMALLIMGYTGNKALKFKIAYINAFNEMEAQLRAPDIDTRLNILTECNQKIASIENHYQSQLIEQQHKLIVMTTEAYQLAKTHIKLLDSPRHKGGITINMDETRPDRFIKQVQNVLKLHPNLNKTQLLKECGYEKTDKTARKWLDAFEGEHWYCSKRSGVYTYNLNVENLEVMV